MLRETFYRVAEPVATDETRGAWLRRWRLMAIDGFALDLPDTTENAAEFGYAGNDQCRSAFPKARVVAVGECGPHAFMDAEVGPWSRTEKAMAASLLPSIPATSCCWPLAASTASPRSAPSRRPGPPCAGGRPRSCCCRS